MPDFDPSTAVEVDDFDPSTAVEVDDFDPSTAVEVEELPITRRQLDDIYAQGFDALLMDRPMLQAIRADPYNQGQQTLNDEAVTIRRQLQERGEWDSMPPQQREAVERRASLGRPEKPFVEQIAPTNPLQSFLGPAIWNQADQEINRGMADASGSAAGGALGARMLMGARGGIPGVVLPLAGAVMGSMAGGTAQEMATTSLEGNPEVTAARMQRTAEAQGPEYKAGGIAAMGALFRPSASVVRGALRRDPEAIGNIALGGGLGVGTAAVHPILEGRMPSTGELLEGGALGLALHQPTRLAQGLFGFRPYQLQPNRQTDTVRTPIGTLDTAGRIVQPDAPEGVALRSLEGLDATKPTEVPSRDAEALLDVVAARHTNPETGTDWVKVRDVLQQMQPGENSNPEFLGVMADALAMAEQRAPRTMEQEIPPDLAPERAAPVEESPLNPKSVELTETQGLPPEYARPEEVPGIAPEEAQRRARLVEEIQADKYATEELPKVEPAAFKEIDRSRAGGFGGGGSTPRPTPVGKPPSGNAQWLKIKPIYARGGFSGLREGAGPVLKNRQKNPIGRRLGIATERQKDVESDLRGRMTRDINAGMKGLSKARQEAAMDEIAIYQREKENSRPVPALSPDAQQVLKGWEDVAEFTGLLMKAKDVKVADAGGYRDPFLIGRKYLPRAFKADVDRAIRNPDRYPVEFNNLVQDLATQRSISIDEASAFLNSIAGGKSRTGMNDFMGNIEMARQQQLPESFYEYDLRKIIPQYVDRYAKRMGQIIAYGQRLGPDGAPTKKNLWDYARDEIRGGDKTTSNWINEAEAQSRNERTLGSAGVIAQRLQTAGTGLLLGDPTSTVPRNLLSGIETQMEMFGARRTLGAFKSLNDAAERVGAKELGIIQDDLATALHAEQLPADSRWDRGIRWVTDGLLKVSGYNASEQFVRTLNFLSGSSFARDAAKAIVANPNSKFSLQAQAMFKRLGVDAAKIAAEGGEWKTGAETQKFIRAAINQTQGSYHFSQVPLWAGTPAGRFLYQFGRWGTQRAQNLWENVFKPAFVGTPIMVRGTPMRVKDYKPLARFGLGTVVLGEAFGALGKLFFDRDRKDATFTEIGTAWNEDKMKAAKMTAGRLINDIIMSGSLGIWGQPIDLLKTAKDGSRMKNPAEPPAMNMARSVVGFGRDVWDQKAVTGDDVMRLAQGTVKGPTSVVNSARSGVARLPDEIAGVSLQGMKDVFMADKAEAENDYRTLRNASERFGQDAGMDVEFKGSSDNRKTERSPVFAGIRDALLVGNSEKAKEIRDKHLASLDTKEERVKFRSALKSSVKARQPFRVGSFNSAEYKKDFLAWVSKNLPKQDQDQINRVQARYEQAAKAAGLW